MDITYDENWPPHIKALYYVKNGNWSRAHDLVDQLNDRSSAHVHAYLHRVEGDDWNARYWYNRAAETAYQGSLSKEWESLWERYVTV